MKRLFILIILLIPFFTILAQEPPAPSDPDGDANGYNYVDLGLPSGTLWAMHNLGAEDPSDYGDYFAWGELEPKEEYTWESYEYVGDYYDLPDVENFFSTEYIGDDISGTEYDAATFNWGKPWRMPKADEIAELRRLCWWKWTTENGIKGMRIYGPNTHSIFFPANGFAWTSANFPGQLYHFQGYYGDYWGSQQTNSKIKPDIINFEAHSLGFDSGGINHYDNGEKAIGFGIRPVATKKEVTKIACIDTDKIHPFVHHSNGRIVVDNLNAGSLLTVRTLSGTVVCMKSAQSNTCTIDGIQKGVYIISIRDNGDIVSNVKIIAK